MWLRIVLWDMCLASILQAAIIIFMKSRGDVLQGISRMDYLIRLSRFQVPKRRCATSHCHIASNLASISNSDGKSVLSTKERAKQSILLNELLEEKMKRDSE